MFLLPLILKWAMESFFEAPPASSLEVRQYPGRRHQTPQISERCLTPGRETRVAVRKNRKKDWQIFLDLVGY